MILGEPGLKIKEKTVSEVWVAPPPGPKPCKRLGANLGKSRKKPFSNLSAAENLGPFFWPALIIDNNLIIFIFY